MSDYAPGIDAEKFDTSDYVKQLTKLAGKKKLPTAKAHKPKAKAAAAKAKPKKKG